MTDAEEVPGGQAGAVEVSHQQGHHLHVKATSHLEKRIGELGTLHLLFVHLEEGIEGEQDEAEVAGWNNEGLPSNRVSTENGAIVTNCT